MLWSLLADAAAKVYEQREVYEEKILYGHPLPREYEAALQTLDIIHHLFTGLCVKRIRMEFPEYAGERFDCGAESTQKLFKENRLQWALRFLCTSVK